MNDNTFIMNAEFISFTDNHPKNGENVLVLFKGGKTKYCKFDEKYCAFNPYNPSNYHDTPNYSLGTKLQEYVIGWRYDTDAPQDNVATIKYFNPLS